MISQEPRISVGIIQKRQKIFGTCKGNFILGEGLNFSGSFTAAADGDTAVLRDGNQKEISREREIVLRAQQGATFILNDVAIGIQFHWQRNENQEFEGDLRFCARRGSLTALNDIGLERYLESVISSEMSAEAPMEFLKAHAVVSRSWLAAMLGRKEKKTNAKASTVHGRHDEEEIVRWYDRDDHGLFDVCADDHCQRYQGITKIHSASVVRAAEETRGVFLLHNGEICDARFHKSCGGRTELFENNWQDTPVPYLQSVSDSPVPLLPVRTEDDARRWIMMAPETLCYMAYCNPANDRTADRKLLKKILPDFDQETVDFFRWKVEYSGQELSALVEKKSGIDFGEILEIVPLQRGPSGRIFRLKIAGTKRTIIVGKELEIRKWFSPSHLLSGAFIVDTLPDARNIPKQFIFYGAGWGHGVGFCQIGAAAMAEAGTAAEAIVEHYFKNTHLKKLY
jgi:SpoIID/LytB domain protein